MWIYDSLTSATLGIASFFWDRVSIYAVLAFLKKKIITHVLTYEMNSKLQEIWGPSFGHVPLKMVDPAHGCGSAQLACKNAWDAPLIWWIKGRFGLFKSVWLEKLDLVLVNLE
jgi:hypothetical protein